MDHLLVIVDAALRTACIIRPKSYCHQHRLLCAKQCILLAVCSTQLAVSSVVCTEHCSVYSLHSGMQRAAYNLFNVQRTVHFQAACSQLWIMYCTLHSVQNMVCSSFSIIFLYFSLCCAVLQFLTALPLLEPARVHYTERELSFPNAPLPLAICTPAR